MATLEVWIDCDLVPFQKIGVLAHDRGVIRFQYDKNWLNQALCFTIDPHLSLDEGAFFPKPEIGNFGVFLDSSPDRWGQTLMKRRESLLAKDEGRKAKTLYAWDFLLGVQDSTRQGALRFKLPQTESFLANEPLAAPPVTSLAELAEIAKEVTRKDGDDLNKLKRWLAVLVAPGASLGGARPKANFSESDGSLWIAKFPAYQDDQDVGAWEGVAYQLAAMAGLTLPAAKVLSLSRSGQHTYCAKRFDRGVATHNPQDKRTTRRFYASAMTLLGKQDNAESASSYLDIAEFLANRGSPETLDVDLQQLFRRVVLGIAIGNRDDHLRNHGFLLTPKGWALSPAFDINPSPDKAEHVLNIDLVDNRPDLDTALSTAAYYRLTDNQAQTIVDQTLKVVAQWKIVARLAGISSSEIVMMESAFLV